ncbi:MAG TPA: hypothetical protein VIX20_09740 [Ktedonobacteraceae bacterium]
MTTLITCLHALEHDRARYVITVKRFSLAGQPLADRRVVKASRTMVVVDMLS